MMRALQAVGLVAGLVVVTTATAHGKGKVCDPRGSWRLVVERTDDNDRGDTCRSDVRALRLDVVDKGGGFGLLYDDAGEPDIVNLRVSDEGGACRLDLEWVQIDTLHGAPIETLWTFRLVEREGAIRGTFHHARLVSTHWSPHQGAECHDDYAAHGQRR
jgi:hypothetical protein